MYPCKAMMLTVAALLLIAGCSRKPPKPFGLDEPRTAMPSLDNSDVNQALALLPEGLPGRCPATPGSWKAGIERRISMRSTSLARTDITCVIGLAVSIGETSPIDEGFVTPMKIDGVSSAVTALQNQDEAGRLLKESLEDLSFEFFALPGGKAELRSKAVIPPEIRETLTTVLPVLPGIDAMRAGAWEFSRTGEFVLPGGSAGNESIMGTGRVAGVSSGRAVVQFDWKSKLTGSSTSDGVSGRITGGSGAGRAVCMFDASGLESCNMSESRTHSVTLSANGAKPRLLEQKVSVDSTFARQP
mgnify:CR=1 FL=1